MKPDRRVLPDCFESTVLSWLLVFSIFSLVLSSVA
jgi:hypothetical protein